MWSIISLYLNDSGTSLIIADDGVQDKQYPVFIKFVKRQYPDNKRGRVKGIGLVNFVHSSGNDGNFRPVNYQIYYRVTDNKVFF